MDWDTTGMDRMVEDIKGMDRMVLDTTSMNRLMWDHRYGQDGGGYYRYTVEGWCEIKQVWN